MNKEEKIRYARLIATEGIGGEGMERLRSGSVMVVGCGALGSLCAMYLAGSGVGHIGIADFDTVDLSNLQRQLFFSESDTGNPKLECLARKISSLNSGIRVETFPFMMTRSKAVGIFPAFDFVVDATDNPQSKYMVDAVCREMEIPYCIGGVRQFEGQVMSWAPGSVPYSDIFPPFDATGGFTPCSIGGVVGPAAGVVASIEASEAIKHLAQTGGMLYNKLFAIDLLSMRSSLIELG